MRGSAKPPKTSWGFARGDEIAPSRTVHALLGGGARLEAYHAWNHRRMEPTVVKILRPNLLEHAGARRAIAREGRLLADLGHPGLARLVEMDVAGERPFIEIEFVEGPRLSTLVRHHGRLDPEHALALGRRLAVTLRFLHAEGVVHLDVKPSNVLIGRTGRLIDLSVARRVELAPLINGFIGTDAFMAPEQADPAGWSSIGPKADTWGFSATLYYAVARRIPHSRGRREGRGVERFPQLVESPAPLDPLCHSPGLVELILACLQPSPDARPDMAELLDRFDELASVAGVGTVRFR